MNKKLFTTACLLMALAIILGAFGAHSLQAKLTASRLLSFETGVRYHIYHSIVLIIISLSYNMLNKQRLLWAVRMIMIGMLFFSGSIYLFTLGHLTGHTFSAALWWTTPLGGLTLIIAWILLARSAFGTKSDEL